MLLVLMLWSCNANHQILDMRKSSVNRVVGQRAVL